MEKNAKQSIFTLDGGGNVHNTVNSVNMDNKQCERQMTLSAKCVRLIRQNLLVTLTLVGVGCGFLVGFLVEPTNPSISVLLWLGETLF